MEVGAKCIDTIDGKSSTIYIAGAIALKNALCNIIAIVILQCGPFDNSIYVRRMVVVYLNSKNPLCQSYCHRKSEKEKINGVGTFLVVVVSVFFQFGINGCFGCWEQERTALLQIKASMINYTYANSFTSWDSANKESDSFNFIYIYIYSILVFLFIILILKICYFL